MQGALLKRQAYGLRQDVEQVDDGGEGDQRIDDEKYRSADAIILGLAGDGIPKPGNRAEGRRQQHPDGGRGPLPSAGIGRWHRHGSSAPLRELLRRWARRSGLASASTEVPLRRLPKGRCARPAFAPSSRQRKKERT